MNTFLTSIILMAIAGINARGPMGGRPSRGNRPSRGGNGPSKGMMGGRRTPSFETEGWEAAWSGLVPDVTSEIPPAPATLIYKDEGTVKVVNKAGVLVSTDDAQNFPDVKFDCDCDKKYMVIVYDSIGFAHGITTNIDGCNGVSSGDEVLEWIPQFDFGRDLSIPGQMGLGINPPPSPHLVMVYEQPQGDLTIDETQSGCYPGYVFQRVGFSPDSLAEKYGLTLVAGNTVNVPYSGTSTNKEICKMAVVCMEQPFFFGINVTITGVTDENCGAVHGI